MRKIIKKYKVGLTFGAFDLLHFGHLQLFQQAKKLCEMLIVCVSDDRYIRECKGKKPVIEWGERMALVGALRCVDFVGPQTMEFGKKEAIEKYKATVLFVGDDWTPKTYTGEGLGVPVIYLPYTKGISSTIIKKKILKQKS